MLVGRPYSDRAVTVRPACAVDAGAIASLCTQLGYPSSAAQVLARLRRLLQSDVDAVYVAESPESTVVGWVHVALRQLVMAEGFAQIEGLVVDEACRRVGVGRSLIQEAERWAFARGHSIVRIRSNVIRVGAHSFYESMGYRRIKEQVAFRKDMEGP